MDYWMLALAVAGVFIQNLFKKNYIAAQGAGLIPSLLFNELTALAALGFLAAAHAFSGSRLTLHGPTAVYGAAFGILFTLELIAGNRALQCGSLALSSLVISCSLAVPTLWGVALMGERPGPAGWCGILLLAVSLALIYGSGARERHAGAPVSLRWAAWVSAAFFANGLCSVLQKLHQSRYPGLYQYELLESSMLSALALGALALFALCRRAAPRPRGLGRSLAASALPNGLANGAVNLFVVLLAARLPASLMFPIISAGGVALTFLASRTVYRERLSPCQLAGFAAGILSVIVLSLS